MTVLIEESTRKPAPLTEEIIGNFRPWMRRGIERSVTGEQPLGLPLRRHTTRPSSSSLTLIWHDSREFGRTSKPKSSMSSSIGVGAPTFSRQASST